MNGGFRTPSGTDIAIESADIIIVRDDVSLVLIARDISRLAFRRVRQNVALASGFNGIGIPLATTGLVYPVWAMVAMAASVTTIFINSIGGRPALLFQAIRSVGRASPRSRMDVVPVWAADREVHHEDGGRHVLHQHVLRGKVQDPRSGEGSLPVVLPDRARRDPPRTRLRRGPFCGR